MGDSFSHKYILDGSNYIIWESRMKAKLQTWKIWQIVNENQVAIIYEKKIEAYNTKKELTITMIFRVVLDEVLLMISSSNSTNKA